ncbi:MAG: type II toxin-antitoxin system HicA family toxin [bacterium]|nr:type II toxin-antitoxin system HicA family toxin [bacterium]
MPKLFSARQVIKALGRAGFVVVSQKGSHIKLKGINQGKICTVIIPNHKEIARGTFISILKQAEMSQLELEKYV